jgi:hypothetical protein
MTEKPVRRFELCTERLKTIKDIKKVLKALQIRIDTDNPLFEELSYYFSTEVVPLGYLKLYEKVGDEIYNMSYDEITKRGIELLNQNEETN